MPLSYIRHNVNVKGSNKVGKLRVQLYEAGKL